MEFFILLRAKVIRTFPWKKIKNPLFQKFIKAPTVIDWTLLFISSLLLLCRSCYFFQYSIWTQVLCTQHDSSSPEFHNVTGEGGYGLLRNLWWLETATDHKRSGATVSQAASKFPRLAEQFTGVVEFEYPKVILNANSTWSMEMDVVSAEISMKHFGRTNFHQLFSSFLILWIAGHFSDTA